MSQRSRTRFIKAFNAMQEANDDLRQELVRHKRSMDKVLRQMSTGTVTPQGIKAGGTPEVRAEMTDAIERFEKARHAARVAAFAHLIAIPGVTASDIARALGISRQLASRLAKEAAN